jgi:HAD superfamily hydrolase (TIGR01509 family)
MRPRAVLFDCDGVLADSEGLVNRVVAEQLTARGWRLSAAEARHAFLGMALPDMVPLIEARTGPLPAEWPEQLSAMIALMLEHEVEPVHGAPEAVAACVAAGLAVAVASNSARRELGAKLHRLGLAATFGPRAFSFEDVRRPKPWPDIYLAAAAACGAAPAECVVVEDSLPGIRAGLAAGCRVLALAPEGDGAAFAALGAVPFTAMVALPALLGLMPAGRVTAD